MDTGSAIGSTVIQLHSFPCVAQRLAGSFFFFFFVGGGGGGAATAAYGGSQARG